MGDAKLAACAAAMSGQAVSRGPAPCGKSKGFSEGRPALPYCMCTCTSTQPDVERSLPAGPARGGKRGDAGTAAPGSWLRSEAVRTQIVVAVTAEKLVYRLV